MKLIYFLLIISVAGIAFVLFRMLSQGELAEKPVYAALQAAEQEHRNKVEAPIVYEDKGGHALAGFSIGSKGRVWISLNSLRNRGNLFALPAEGEKLIPCHLVDQISTSAMISPDVASILRSSCAESN